MKKISIILSALVFALVLTYCKKEETPATTDDNTNNGVMITLSVGNNSRADVNPTGNENWATVSYEVGDSIYVGYNGVYVGCLECKNTSANGFGQFEGFVTIDNVVEGEKLHFYMLGGKGFQPNPATITDNQLIVNLSDQTTKYPVISYATSNEEYNASTITYTSNRLMNKCSIMKFSVTKPAESISAVCIAGMKNKVTVNFNPTTTGTDDGFTYLKDGTGQIMMKGGRGASIETWAIVLPQGDLEEAAGKVYINGYEGMRPAISEIVSNQYLNDGIDLTINTQTDKLIGLFSVSSTKQVHFSKGNLQATTSDLGVNWTWSFAPNQYTWIGNTVANTAINGKGTVSSNGSIDLFGYSTDNANNFFGIINSKRDNYYPDGPTRGPFLDWGVNSIGGCSANYWYTMEKSNWEYLLNARTTPRFAKVSVNGVNGMLLFPDNFSWNTITMGEMPSTVDNTSGNYNSTNCSISLERWSILEATGVVFLPGTGYRSQGSNSVNNINPARGYYWFSDTNGTQSGSGTTYDNNNTYYLYFLQGGMATTYTMSKRSGAAVRLVHDAD